MIGVTVDYEGVDACTATTTWIEVFCNEVVNGLGDGNTSSDWQVVDGHHVQLRAERSGTGN